MLSGATRPEPEAREHENMWADAEDQCAKRWVEKASAEQQEAGGQWTHAGRLLSWSPNERHGK